MEVDQLVQVHITNPIAVGEQECIVLQVARGPQQAASRHGVLARFGQGHLKMPLVVTAMNEDLLPLSETDRKIVAHGFIVKEVFPGHPPAIAEAKNEFIKAVMRI